MNVQARRIEPVVWDDLGREVAIPSAGTGDVEIVLASHARTYAERVAIREGGIAGGPKAAS